MSLPTVHGVARLTEDPELRYSSGGVAVCKLRMAFNSRKQDQSGTWVDDKVCYLDGTVFKQVAENCAEGLTKGVEICVTGRLVTEQWEDRQSGEKRSKVALLVDEIGPSIRFNSVKVNKMQRSGGQDSGGGFGSPSGGQRSGQSRTARSVAPDDPWASMPSGQGTTDDIPPF